MSGGGEGGGGIHVMYIRDFVLEHVTIVSNTNGYAPPPNLYGGIRREPKGGGIQLTYETNHTSYVREEDPFDYNISMNYCIVYNNFTTDYITDKWGRIIAPDHSGIVGSGITTWDRGGYNTMGDELRGLSESMGFDNWVHGQVWTSTPTRSIGQEDPQFTDMRAPGVGGGDYHIAEDSPATSLHTHSKNQYDYDYNLRGTSENAEHNLYGELVHSDDYGGYQWNQPPTIFKIKGITGANRDITRTITAK